MSVSITHAPRFPTLAVTRALFVAGLLTCSLGSAYAAGSFTITGSSSTAQNLGANQTGSVSATGNLTLASGISTVAVTISGNNATLTNLGSIIQNGTGRVIRDNTGVTGLMITNGSVTNSTALMQSADADVIQMNVANGSVTLNNYGQMVSLNASRAGAQAVDFSAITTGANVVNNYAGAVLKSSNADAVRPGVNGVVNNSGTIQSTVTTDTGTDGIDFQNNSGVQVNNFSTGLIDGARHGITGGSAITSASFVATINNSAGGVIRGNNGSGINLDGSNAMQVVTVVNGGTISGNGVTGDGDGIDVDGLVNITNTGTIRSVNAFSALGSGLAYSEGITVGGGTITNSGLIEGLVAAGNTNAVGRGISLLGNDVAGAPVGTREAIYGNAVVNNLLGGVIRGGSDSAIYVDGPASGYTVVINNNAGASILGGGTTNAAIHTGADNDTINNAGLIDGSSSGRAIDMGAGNNTLYVSGGAASILGSINGGLGGNNTMTVEPGNGQSFAYAGSISNFGTVEIRNGHVIFSGVSDYSGITRISGGILTLSGVNRLSAASALELNAGTLELANASGVDGQTFASLSLLNNASIALNFSRITFNSLGTVLQGKVLTVLDAGQDYALRFAGDLSGNAQFLALIQNTTVNGLAASYRFDGAFTDVSAVPEPESLAMLLAGLGLVAGAAGRRKQKRGA